MKTNNVKITALGYDWLKVDNGVSKYIKVDKGGRPCLLILDHGLLAYVRRRGRDGLPAGDPC
jgi:hypothetical protein